ncbi:GNAT family N-acetyltransferase [Streptomyces sp. SL13]|uniref:GNAT family N-acetyltransferase n=1 Tax=Streptantibioticus silvisoli TaxID=2705255 RepID=A0AA90K7Q2_9ACTN|nr:GNAT family N-acetyltransferase [Streptantibioticus silvisoli]MDI5968547.1 GNAT family N-acetyltransferase [Streptantibioticus silvisoli]
MSDVKHLESIDDIGQNAWDGLVPGSRFYQSHAWLRGQERPDFATAGYVTVMNDGALAAATPYYDFPARTAPPLPDVAQGYRVLRVGTRTGNHNEFLVSENPGRESEGPGRVSEDPEKARELLGDLVAGVAEKAADLGCDALLFDCLTTDSLRRLAGLYPVQAQLRAAEAVLRNDGGTFASYRGMLGRNAVKRDYEIRRFENSGLRMETAPLSECVDEFAPLVGQTMDRYSASLDPAEIHAFLSVQARCLDGLSTVFRCVDEEGRLVGGNLCFAWRDTFYARVAGFDYTRTRNAFEYFNAVYYAPLRHMECAGMTSLHLGLSALEAKVRRGASVCPLWAAVVPLPLTATAGLRRDVAADRKLADALMTEAGGGTDPEEWDLASIGPL